MNFADTNWLIALYTNPPEKQKGSRQNIAANFMRRNDGRLALSHPVLIETHNILCRLSGKPNPDEWEELQADFNGKIYVDPMNWSLMRAEADRLFARYAWKEKSALWIR